MRRITGLQIQYLHLCYRKLWLYSKGIGMELSSSLVAEGTLIGEMTYQRRPQKWKELNLGHLKIDHFDPQANTVREVKKSPKLEHAHIAQVKYYLYALEQRGVHGADGVIEYPKQRKSTTVELTDADRKDIKEWEARNRTYHWSASLPGTGAEALLQKLCVPGLLLCLTRFFFHPTGLTRFTGSKFLDRIYRMNRMFLFGKYANPSCSSC